MASQAIDFRIDGLLDPLPAGERDELARFIGKARENGLHASDYYTIRDLQELSGYKDRALTMLLTCLFLALREGSVCMELSRDALLQRLDGVLDRERAERAAAEIRAALGGAGPGARSKTDAFAGTEAGATFAELIGSAVDSDKPVVRRTEGGRDLLYFQKYLRHETKLHALLQQRFAGEVTAAPTPQMKVVFAEAVATRKKKGAPFSAGQKFAIGLALLRKLVVISGGPGTGKTSAVVAILHCLIRGGVAPERILLGCPTGRAAQRLTESIRASAADFGDDSTALLSLRAKTLHRLLGYSGATGRFNYRRDNPLPADVLIVDEVSMMDIVLTSRLLEAAPASARIILLGDKDQLPSVDAGSVLADLLPERQNGAPAYSAQTRANLQALTGAEPPAPEGPASERSESVVILTTNFRSQQHITDTAREINGLSRADRAGAEAIVAKLPALTLVSKGNQQLWPELSTLRMNGCDKDGGVFRIEQHKLNAWRGTLDAWARHHYIDSKYPMLVKQAALSGNDAIVGELEQRIAKIFAIINGARVLTLLREGNWGCEGVNAYLAQFLQPHTPGRTAARIFPGAPVLITSNNYQHELYNGDVGVALKNQDGALRVVFERQDEAGKTCYAALPVELLPGHELAFAMTVHKSQGSEYSQVLLVLPPEGGQRLQNRQLIYTAITRAKDLAVCFGSREALSGAIARTIERCSGM